MDKNNSNNKLDEKNLRTLFEGSKLKANENLGYRIVQQIRTEDMLARKVVKVEKGINRQINNLLTVLGVSYGIVLLTVLGFYLYFGKDIIKLPEFYLSIIFVISVSTVFGVISYFDEKLRAKYGDKLGSRKNDTSKINS